MSNSKHSKACSKMDRALKRIVQEDNPELDLDSSRYGMIVSVIVKGDEDASIMHYKIDPLKCESLEDSDTMGMILHMVHKAQEPLFDEAVERVSMMSPMFDILNMLKDKLK